MNKASKAKKQGTQLTLDNVKAGIYLRVSTEEQADSGYGIEDQRIKCTAMATVKGWSIVKEYNDAGISGTKDATKRPGLAALLADAKAGVIDVVITLSFNRLGRKAKIVLDLASQLAQYDTQLVSCKENLDTTTPTGKFTLLMFAGLAELERDQTAERTEAGLTVCGNNNGYKGGKMPYGYTYLGTPTNESYAIEVNPEETTIVQRIFSLKDSGVSLRKITAILNTEATPAPRGDKWHLTTVALIVNNREIYRGAERYASGQTWPIILDQEPTRASA
jgi:site-specific DNA recombinase